MKMDSNAKGPTRVPNADPSVISGESMKITMNDEESITQLKSFLKEVAVVNFSINHIGNKNKQEMYDWVGTVIRRFRYFSLKKKERKSCLITL